MGALTIVKSVFKACTGPLGVLEDWAKEPLKAWENTRNQENKDRDVEREIRKQTGVATVNAELKIRMETEIARINAETEQWIKDEEFRRMKDVAEAIIYYRERLTELQVNTIRAIGNMDIELREKAQDLILAKTREYKALQDQAQLDAEAEFERIIEKFSCNERVLDIMITNAQKKLASIVDGTAKFLEGLNQDITQMSANIDSLTTRGQEFIDKQLEQFNGGMGIPNSVKKQLIDRNVEQ